MNRQVAITTSPSKIERWYSEYLVGHVAAPASLSSSIDGFEPITQPIAQPITG